MTSYNLTRSKRKTVALYIRDGSVEVRAPLKMPKAAIDQFVATNEKWILDKLLKANERQVQRESFSLAYGDTIPYRGNQYPIIAKDGDRVGFDGEGFCIPPGLEPERIRRICIQIYRRLAKCYLTNRTMELAKRMSVVPSAVKISDANTRWGSCSAKKNLNLSWRLIMAEDDTIDYVIVHELAHIIELNHSRRFWAVVESVFPGYREQKIRLKELQHRLDSEDWKY